MSVSTVPADQTDRRAFGPVEWALFVAIGLIWGASFLLIAIGLRSFHPGLVTWARVGSGALALAVLPASRVKIAPEDRTRLVGLSWVWVGIPFTLFPLAEEHINSAVTGLLNGATPIFSGVIAALFFNRTPRGPQRVGIAIGFVGVAVMSLASSGGAPTAARGVLMVLAATFCYGIATNVAGPLQHKYGSVAVMAKMLALATLWTTPFGIYGLIRSTWSFGPTLAVVVLGVFGTGAAFGLMAELVGRVGGPRATVITYLIPIVSLVLGAVFLGDRVAPMALVGVLIVLMSAVLISRREH